MTMLYKETMMGAALAASLLGSTAVSAYTVSISPIVENPAVDTFAPYVGQIGGTIATDDGTFFLGLVNVEAGGVTMPNFAVAPSDSGAYLAVHNFATFQPDRDITSVSFNWGTPDDGSSAAPLNEFCIDGTAASFCVNGTLLTSIGPANVTVSGFGGLEFAQWREATQGNAFEVNDVTFGLPVVGAPELSTWMMLCLGFCGLGYAAIRRKREAVA